jgi:hypothetical protein
METTTLAQQFVELPEKASEAAEPVDGRTTEENTARSEENILKWMAYLPEDCIRTMINMGWDITT